MMTPVERRGSAITSSSADPTAWDPASWIASRSVRYGSATIPWATAHDFPDLGGDFAHIPSVALLHGQGEKPVAPEDNPADGVFSSDGDIGVESRLAGEKEHASALLRTQIGVGSHPPVNAAAVIYHYMRKRRIDAAQGTDSRIERIQFRAVARNRIRTARDHGKIDVTSAKSNLSSANSTIGINAFDDFVATQRHSHHPRRKPVYANCPIAHRICLPLG